MASLPPLPHLQTSGTWSSEYASGNQSGNLWGNQWGTLMDSGMITGNVQVQVSQLLDMPRRLDSRGAAVPYVLRASDRERELAVTAELGGQAPVEADRGSVSLGPEGVMQLSTSSVLIFVQVEFADGQLIGRCQISRLDPRSPKTHQYGLNDTHDQPANCGLELTVVEGTFGGSAGTGASPELPGMPMPPGVSPGATGGAQPLGNELVLQITRLLDLPQRSTERGSPLSYKVHVFDQDEELGVANVETLQAALGRSAGGVETVGLGMNGHLRLRTNALMLSVHVDYADGRLLGSCQIHRRDPRSATVSAYMLSDRNGAPVNCGIELQVTEVTFASTALTPGADMPPMPVGGGACLQVRVLAAYNLLNRDTGLFGDVSDPFVVVKVGSSEFKTPTIDNDLNPVWKTGNAFTFSVKESDSSLELEVMNANYVASDSLGKTTLGLWSLPPGEWLRRRERLTGGQDGELEFEARFDPPGSDPAAAAPAPEPEVPLGAPPNLPALPAGAADKGGALPPSEALGPGQGWVAPLLARGLPPPAAGGAPYQDPLGLFPDTFDYHYKSHEPWETWLAPPAASPADAFFGTDLDMEIKAATAEPWMAPALPSFDENYHVDYFPDMDVGLLKRKEDRAKKPQDRQIISKRQKQNLPELALDSWVTAPPPQKALPAPEAAPAPAPKPKPKPLTAPVQPTAQAKAATGRVPRTVAEARRHRQRARLQVELGLVRPEQARDIEEQCRSSRVTSPDMSLELTSFEAQVVGCLEFGDVGEESVVWARSPHSGTQRLTLSGDSWLEPFQTGELLVGVSCRRGLRGSRDPLPAQDNFSMTQITEDTALFVICDGHGPFGHLAAFRVAQSLPKFAAERLLGEERVLPEKALLDAFERAQQDLVEHSADQNLDLSRSGATCAVALRMGADVQVAWLGDARAMVATVTPDHEKLDLVTPVHTTDDVKEYQRVLNRGAILRAVPPGAGLRRIFAKNERGPGLSATRALGDLSATSLGVAWQPDIRKMSFATTPGLVLLGSGGFWAMLDENTNDPPLALVLGEGQLRQSGPAVAAGRLVAEVQERWREAAGGFCDDAACLLLQWPRPQPRPVVEQPAAVLPPSPPPPQGTQVLPMQQALPPMPPTGTIPHEEMRRHLSEGLPASHERAPEPVRLVAAHAAPAPPTSSFVSPAADYSEWRAQVSPAPPAQMAPLRSCGRLKPTALQPLPREEDVEEELAMHRATPALSEPDVELLPEDFLVQVLGCLEAGVPSPSSELPIWLRTHFAAGPSRMDFEDAEAQLQDFAGSSPCRFSVQCRRGQRRSVSSWPNQDNFSVTYAHGDRAVYVVCDGHGPLGHLVAFRAVQSLPKFVLEGLAAAQASVPAENVIAKAFDAAHADLVAFAADCDLDISGSGATASLALRQGDGVHVAWLGDSRALVATVVGQDSRLDLFGQAHSPAEAAERQRLQRSGAELQGDALLQGPDGCAALRVFEPGGSETPGLSVSRTLGDTALTGLGVLSRPDLAKTSFASTPGLVLLASGGLCELVGDGEEVLGEMLYRGQLVRWGPQQALSCVCDLAQERWREAEPDYCDDVTGLLLHWPSLEAAPAQVVQAVAPLQAVAAQAPTPQVQPQRFLRAQPASVAAASVPLAQPLAAQPLAAQPLAAQPLAAHPLAAQPLAAQPLAAQPLAAQPLAAQPLAAQPLAAQPLAQQPRAQSLASHAQTWAAPLAQPVAQPQAQPLAAQPQAQAHVQPHQRFLQAAPRAQAGASVMPFAAAPPTGSDSSLSPLRKAALPTVPE